MRAGGSRCRSGRRRLCNRRGDVVKSLLYPVLAVLVVIVLVCVIGVIVEVVASRRKRRAVRSARWESYARPAGDGSVQVGVRLVARWGRHEKILRSERMTRVRVDDWLGTELVEARSDADMRAASYNAIGGR